MQHQNYTFACIFLQGIYHLILIITQSNMIAYIQRQIVDQISNSIKQLILHGHRQAMGYQLWAIVKIAHFLTRLNFKLTKKSHTKNVTPLLRHCSYILLALTHQYIILMGELWAYILQILETIDHVDGSVQERHDSIANTLELRLSCTNSSILWQTQAMISQTEVGIIQNN